jgi:hypothetical protein
MEDDFQKGGVAIIIVISFLVVASILAGVYFYLDKQLTDISTILEVSDKEKLDETEPSDLTEEQSPEDLCQNECSTFGERECINKESYHICSYDAQNCLKWSPAFSCLEDAECQNGDCVKVSPEQKPEEPTDIIQCSSGPCCNLAIQKFRPVSYVCHAKARTEYGCPWGNQVGSDVGVRYQNRYCSGSSADCNGELKWTNWYVHQECLTDEACKDGECIALDLCQDQCSSTGLKRCSNNSYQVCGDYNEDSCLEWSSLVSCPSNTICQNGNCIQQQCADGTSYGQCSTNKPKYCDNGSLISECSVCGCSSGQECQSDGSCKITEEDNFCGEYYGGVVFDGFCFTDFDKTVFDYPRAENGILRYTPDGSNVERIVRYPTSIKIVDFGIDSDIDITLENKGQSSETIRFNNFEIFIYNVEELNIDEQYTVQPGETKNIEIPINLPEISARPNVSRFIRFDDNSKTYSIERIIFYWDNIPFSSEEFLNVEECGERKYVENQGVCYDDTIFPSIDGLSCHSDSDCLNYRYREEGIEEFGCYEYTCLDMSENYIISPRNKEYEVGILPLYVTDDDNQYNIMRNAVNNHLDEIVPKMENWFSNEKLFWGIYDLFNFDYFKINDGCRMTHAQFQEIHLGQRNMLESELRAIENQCIDNKNYDILIISIQRDDYWDPSFVGAGINYETIIASALNPRTIIHEILHSFGEHDMYGVESYQWGNCYLYNANTGGDWNEEMPHLCKFEAMQLDWLLKIP